MQQPASEIPVSFAESFKKDFTKVLRGNAKLEQRFLRVLQNLKTGVHTSGMNIEKIEGYEKLKGLRSVRISDDIRMSYIASSELHLLRIGHHDGLYRNPV